ncbi:unnamed protein product [Paramecium pentaurelia]|uniref:Uncharacterized protein n=1 Tax=Paramecium pentaurelia TaxID=43138 RepID=A0A8S1SE83_9CILI|nr:unnamed protein product [Paramecium pentaurelia]
MNQEISKEILALSIHVAAAASSITVQTQQRMTLVTNSVLETVSQTMKIINFLMLCSQKQSQLEAVTEEQEDEGQKDSKTKECLNEQFLKTVQSDCFNDEVIENQKEKENCPTDMIMRQVSELRGQSILKSNNNLSEEYPKCNVNQVESATPIQFRKPSLLSQQLSLIKVDKQKEAEEQRELMKLIESVDPIELIPKLKQIEIYDEYKRSSGFKDILVYSNKQQIVINEQEAEEQLMDTPNKSEWYENSSVEYRATSYNTNESSNLDHHSYKWKSSSFGDDNMIQECGFQFQSSVFDFPFPEDFCANSQNIQTNIQNIENKNQHTPKKKRLYCNNKKVPHWAENLERVSQHQNQQQNLSQNQIFGRMKQRVLDIAKQFSLNRFNKRGSSAQWHISNEKYEQMQKQMMNLQQIQDQNIIKLKQHQEDSVKKNQGLYAKTQYFLTSIKKKILNSFEKEYKFKNV